MPSFSSRNAMMRLVISIAVLGINWVEARECHECGQGGLCCSTLANDPIQYAFTFPLTVLAGSSIKACLTIHGNQLREDYGPIKMKVALNAANGSVYDRAKGVATMSTHERCFNLLVPSGRLVQNELRLAYAKLRLLFIVNGRQHQLNAEQKVFILPPDSSTSVKFQVFIHTDKSIYNPGQTVLFRILQLQGMYPASSIVEKITISDAKGRKLMMLRDRLPKSGLVSDKFELVAEPNLGRWKIEVEIEGQPYYTHFSVEEYVLPKFEALIDVPKFVHLDANPFPVTICLKYVHGNPVNGTISCSISTSYDSSNENLNDLLTDQTGCINIEVDLNYWITNQHSNGRINIAVTGTDNLSGEMVQATNEDCKVTSTPFIIDIINMQDLFTPGMPYEFEIFYHDIADAPISAQEIAVKITSFRDGNVKNDSLYYNTTTDYRGRSRIVLTTSTQISYYQILVSEKLTFETKKIKQPSVTWIIKKANLKLSWFVDINKFDKDISKCGQPYNLTGKAVLYCNKTCNADSAALTYQVFNKDVLIDHGLSHVTTNECEDVSEIGAIYLSKGSFQMALNTEAWSEETIILVFMINENGIGADNVTVRIPTSCLADKVNLTMNKKTARPGEDIVIGISDQPNSSCALTIRDKSVHLMGVENDITEDKIQPPVIEDQRIKEFFEVTRKCHFFENFDKIYSIDGDGYLNYNWRYVSYKDPNYKAVGRVGLITKIFQVSKFVLVSNVFIDEPLCNISKDYFYFYPYFSHFEYNYYDSPEYALSQNHYYGWSDFGNDIALTQERHTDIIKGISVRNYFPETWKWDLIEIGPGGSMVVSDTLPDTITEWIASTYCVSESFGIRFSPQILINGFKPIFLSLSMPYSVIRGEEFTLMAILHSYFDKNICLEMLINLEESEDFVLLDSESIRVQCICGGGMQQIKFNVRPLHLGEIQFTLRAWSREPNICGSTFVKMSDATDGVERILLVESEGIEVESTKNDFLCLNESGSRNFQFSHRIFIPEDHYEDSARLLVNVIGTVMGPVLDNLDHLIQAPFGCGEQNMITMVPNIVVFKYLTAVGKMTPKLKEKIEKNILNGYQRELNYQRRDGSFSAFGDSDEYGSSWLTAFVISTFKETNRYIAIDEEVVERAKSFLKTEAREGNCFKKIGLVHHKDMMGGADGHNALDAYIKLALLERDNSIEDKTKYDIYGCDGNSDLKVYTRAIKFYTNALKERERAANYLWDTLKQDARFEDGDSFENAKKVFWSDEEHEESVNDDYQYWWHYEKPSDAVEVTAYVLLGYLKMTEMYPDRYPILESSRIVQWLTSQRNARGSFSSTQNTVLGLTALSEYASRILASTKMTVTINNGREDVETFKIDDDNNIVLQQSLIRPPPSTVTYNLNGHGCVLIQTNTKFNTPEEPTHPSFLVSVHVHSPPGGCSKTNSKQLVICATYQGSEAQPSSNMAVFEITMVSGYQASKDSLKLMGSANVHNGLKRYEIDGKKINIYFEELSSERKCAAFELKHTEKIKNPQPGLVHVFDYYDPVKSTTVKYNLSCIWETYQEKFYQPDCLLWDINGHCGRHCVRRVGTRCDFDRKLEEPIDFCSRGDQCGRHGTCINTGTFLRCACHSGWKLTNGVCHLEDDKPECISRNCTVTSRAGIEEISCLSGYRLTQKDGVHYCEIDNEIAAFSDNEVSPDCPICWENFPHPSNFSSVFCPKHNVYIGSMKDNNLFNLRPFISGGIVSEGDTLRDVEIGIHVSCKCPTLKRSRFFLFTTNNVTDHRILIDNSKIIPKQHSRTLRDYECP